MRNYDPAFHLIVVGDSIYFGSSADDAVHCLDAKTGKRKWFFATGGPVRIAPAWHNGRLYFGSDDGCAYCVRADDGKLLWRYNPVEDRRLVLNDARFISFWPIRTGVVVDGGTAYFGASMLPWKKSYLCAVDAERGRPQGAGRFVKEFEGLTLEGAMLASSTHLLSPQGRVPPLLFKRSDGEKVGGLQGGGGCFVLLTPDEQIYHGPGDRTTTFFASAAKDRTQIASYPRGNLMVVSGNAAYLLTDDSLAAIDRSDKEKKPIWIVKRQYPYSLIVSGDTLFVGGEDEVAAFSAKDGAPLWKARVEGRAYGLAVATGGLFVATDEGVIHCFREDGGGTESSAKPGSGPQAPQPPETAADKDLIARWVFHRRATSGGEWVPPRGPVPDLGWVSERAVLTGGAIQDLAGANAATVDGSLWFQRAGEVEAAVFDGAKGEPEIASRLGPDRLPANALTVEAWVSVQSPGGAGGIISALGGGERTERGWALGYRDKRFAFSLSTGRGETPITRLVAESEIEPEHWHHLAATYDGDVMKLFINGQEAGTTTTQKGPIGYAPATICRIGAVVEGEKPQRLTGLLHEARIYGRALPDAAIQEQYEALRKKVPVRAELRAGPRLQFVDGETAVVRWETEKPSPTILTYGQDRPCIRLEDAKEKREHEVVLRRLRRNRMYSYVVGVSDAGQAGETSSFECDTFFNYNPLDISGRPNPYSKDEPFSRVSAQVAERILASAKMKTGLCLVLGLEDGSLAYELAKASGLTVVGVDADPAKISRIRRRLQEAGLYGSRLSVLHVKSLGDLPLPERCANLVASESALATGKCVGAARKIARLLRPKDGLAFLGGPADAEPRITADALGDWLKDGDWKYDVTTENGVWAAARAPGIEGAGVWSHQYGLPDNAAFGGEDLRGATTVTDLEVQWVGRPGPRHQPDRQGRKPAPLATNGRLFAQGLHRIIALDSYNGAVLWSVEIPDLQRFNMPRDCGNWCADDDHVFAAVKDRCWRLDADTGKVSKIYRPIPPPDKAWEWDWGYIARHGDNLLGSAVKRGAVYTSFWGGYGWYDGTSGETTLKVCSDSLFALDKASGSQAWFHSEGVIINSTIAIGDGRVCFVECRNAKIKGLDSRRIGEKELWLDQCLVALDAGTGNKLWEKPIDTEDGIAMFNLAHGGGKLVLLASANWQYYVYTFDAANGSAGWNESFRWGSDNHGGHMSRPVIVGNALYIRPAVFDLLTGEKREFAQPGGGCGTYAATTTALVYRAGNIAMWAPCTTQVTSWDRLRPDCWLSAVPAAGMLLAPEGGGGCSCGSWMETSIAFAPKRRPEPSFRSQERTFVDSTQVELLNHVEGGVVRYTLDGTDPTQQSPEFTVPVTLAKTTTIKGQTFWARGEDGEPVASDVMTRTLERIYPAPAVKTSAKTFVDSVEVDLDTKTKQGVTRYTLDGSEPTAQSPVYGAPIALSETTTITAKTFWTNPEGEGDRASENLVRGFQRVFPPPKFAPQSQAFVGSTKVELLQEGREGVVRYALDGATPTQESPVYSGAIALDKTTTLTARTFWEKPRATAAAVSDVAARRFERIEPKLARNVKINFQPAKGPRPEGYLVDTGAAFHIRDEGCAYGWSSDNQKGGCRRGINDDPLLDTLVHFQPNVAWAIAVENGEYDVTVCVGDSQYPCGNVTVEAEGVEIIKKGKLAADEFRRVTKRVAVRDGALTLASHDESDATRINYVEIAKVGTPGQ
jgi:outer membrane protein assembly factor BamB